MDIKSTWINSWTVTAFEGYSLSYASRKIEIPLRKDSYNQASKFCGNNHLVQDRFSESLFWFLGSIYIYFFSLQLHFSFGLKSRKNTKSINVPCMLFHTTAYHLVYIMGHQGFCSFFDKQMQVAHHSATLPFNMEHQ